MRYFITAKSVLSTAVLNFFSYLDVSKVTLTVYRIGIKQFIAFVQLNGEKVLCRNAVLKFRARPSAMVQAVYNSPRLTAHSLRH